MMTPHQYEQEAMGLNGNTYAIKNGKRKDRTVTSDENKVLRLAFHDCIPYMDRTGGQCCQNKIIAPLLIRVPKLFFKFQMQLQLKGRQSFALPNFENVHLFYTKQ